MGSSPTLGANYAGVAELADAQDLKSCDVNSSYRFDSGPRHQFFRPHGQAVKTSPFHGGNPGSNPGGVTIIFFCGGVAQLARACGSYPQCQGFKSLLRYHFYIIFFYIVVIFGRIAQLGEHLPYKQGVIGSSPIVPTK